MGDDVKDEPAKPKETTFTGKAGWLKKSSGKFLSSYKDRYVQLDKTEFAVYENEDLKNCMERLDLENYDKCHELRSPFKKKYRLILIRAPKSASKVCDVKLQAQNQEEKEAWIKALSDGINRAKNKIFDEVKVDESLSLDHVTRTRPKGNRSRRPPTRIHMKEAASISDGILRLDLDTADNMPNGAHFLVDDADGKAKVDLAKSFEDIPEEAADEDTAPQKKVLKPPMPPSKENKPSESQDSEDKHEELAPQKKILMPPMPPSKEQKPSENTEEEKGSEEETVVKPPMPPSKENKPSESQDSEDKHEELAPQKKILMPPMPPSKEQKPSENTEEEKGSEEETVVKPPMPPSKENKPSESQDSEDKHEELAPQKKILMPPMPPSKEQKPSENTEEEKGSKKETVVKPPMPPSKENKPILSPSGDASEDTASENSESEAATTPGKSSPVQGETDGPETVHPPSPPSKDMKPKQALDLSDEEFLSEVDEGFPSKENEEAEAESGKTEDKPFTLSNKVPKPQGVMWDTSSSAVEKNSVDQTANVSAESVANMITHEPAKPASELKLTPYSTPEAVKKSVPPPAPPKKKPLKPPVKMENQVVQDDCVVSTNASFPETVSSSVEKGSEITPSDETKLTTEEPKEEIVILSLSNSGASEDLDDVSGVEVKSIDSGQLSAEDSESSEQVTPSTDKLQSSLEVLDDVTSEEELETPDSSVQKMEDPLSAILTVQLETTMDDSSPVTGENTHTLQISSPASSLNSSLKKRSASTGDLLEEVKGLQRKVSIELEETGELLGKIAPRGSPEAGQDSEAVTDPEILLATAMEKLRKADQFLREAKNFKEQENKSNRTSW
ncbi:muscle M-line assembly protein unc-89 [Neoarius graeffei]|uniref:muscle M-line assembly protein unc-89 n=1 Tax=Neoarius graeffei TaxID=443677 RepID=UPI00298D536E|nr:muscle M-line assembly protein unc-89 [Neoarius graeffei]